ncbi:hypothetical protein Trydic_g696 [Trypoxylus dichotomus]
MVDNSKSFRKVNGYDIDFIDNCVKYKNVLIGGYIEFDIQFIGRMQNVLKCFCNIYEDSYRLVVDDLTRAGVPKNCVVYIYNYARALLKEYGDVNKLPGPSQLQLLWQLISAKTNYETFQYISGLNKKYGSVIKLWIKPFKPTIMVADIDLTNKILMSKDHLGKTKMYDLLKPYVGDGLATTSNDRLYSAFLANDLIFRFTSRFKLMKEALDIVKEYTRTIVRTEGRKKQTGTKKYVIDFLVANSISEEFLNDNINSFILAGHDPMAQALCFTIYELSRHAQVQQKLFEEIVSIVGEDSNALITSGNLQLMKYLDAVIKEALRVHNVAPIIERKISYAIEFTKLYAMLVIKFFVAKCLQKFELLPVENHSIKIINEIISKSITGLPVILKQKV